ncbi:MAG: hypothetical protein ABIP88_02565 [Candidatus Binatia bacterium]
MPTINMRPRIETTRIDDYCVTGGIVLVPPTVCIANADPLPRWLHFSQQSAG